MEHFPIPVIDTLCCKLRRNSSSAISVPDIVVEDDTDDLCFTRYDLQIMHIMSSGVDPPRFDKPITICPSKTMAEDGRLFSKNKRLSSASIAIDIINSYTS